MFNGGSDDVAPVSRRRFAQTPNREVVSFSAAGSEHDLVRLGADQGRDLATRAIDRCPSLLAERVNTGWISVSLGERSGHSRRHARVDRRRGAVIQVNAAIRGHFSFYSRNLLHSRLHLSESVLSVFC